MVGYLAIDIGASSGRHIFGYVENGKLITQEIYRFKNEIKKQNGNLVWDIGHIASEVIGGIAKCHDLNLLPKTVAIDTWGVDYVLLSKEKQPILPVYSYRDFRTDKIATETEHLISSRDLYNRTAIQKQNFNTVYQLYCDSKEGRLDYAKYFLMIPEYLSYVLTGKINKEYTNATTTGLVKAGTDNWDAELLSVLKFPADIFTHLEMPGFTIGPFSRKIKELTGIDSTVVFCPSHDTASAVAACPLDESSMYVSSGTWSLIGIENKKYIVTRTAQNKNYTNEGGIDLRYRFLKNIMGTWILQKIRSNLNNAYTYDELMCMAESSNYVEYFDVNAQEFMAPENMIDAVRNKIGNPTLELKDVLNCVYHSLAYEYQQTVKEIEKITRKRITSIYIIGGGSRDKYLNSLVKNYTDKTVYAGLEEATAIGNLLSQIMTDNGFSLQQAREIVRRSFRIEEVYS